MKLFNYWRLRDIYDVRRALGVYGSDDLIMDHIIKKVAEESFYPKEHYHKGNNIDEIKNSQSTLFYRRSERRK